MRLWDILKGLDPDMLLSDGAMTYTVERVMDFAAEAVGNYSLGHADNGTVRIYRSFDDDWYGPTIVYRGVTPPVPEVWFLWTGSEWAGVPGSCYPTIAFETRDLAEGYLRDTRNTKYIPVKVK